MRELSMDEIDSVSGGGLGLWVWWGWRLGLGRSLVNLQHD